MTTKTPEPVLGLTISPDLLDALAEAVQARVVVAKTTFTTEGLAEHLGVTARYVRGMGQRGCPFHRVGKRAMWLLPEVEAWLARR